MPVNKIASYFFLELVYLFRWSLEQKETRCFIQVHLVVNQLNIFCSSHSTLYHPSSSYRRTCLFLLKHVLILPALGMGKRKLQFYVVKNHDRKRYAAWNKSQVHQVELSPNSSRSVSFPVSAFTVVCVGTVSKLHSRSTATNALPKAGLIWLTQ